MSTAGFILLQASLRGGALILAVLLLRVLLRKLPKRYTCVLWTAVWLRLALPFAVRSRFSLLPEWSFLVRSAAVPLLTSETVSAAAPSAVAPMYWPLLIWAAGLVILLLCAGIRYLLLKRKLRQAIPFRLQAHAERDNGGRSMSAPTARHEGSLENDGRLWLCDWVESPFVLGLFRPRIYLPSGVEERDIPWISAHEETHLRRGDPWRKLGAFLLTAIYWFQPLVWAAFFLYQRDLELACDEQTIRGYDSDARNAYISALLRASVPSRRVWAFPMGFGSAPVRKRIEAILHPSGCGHGKLVLAALFCAVILLTLTVEPVQAVKTAPEAEQPLSEPSLEAELPPSETASELPAAEQPESGRSEHSETAGWKNQTENDGAETKWFLVDNPSGEASVLLRPDGSSVVLYGEPVIMLYDEDSGQTIAIGPVSPGGDVP